MATAHDENVATGGRRRKLGWAILFCFGSRRERGQEASASETTTIPWERSRRRRKKRTVPVVDGEAGTVAGSEAMRRGADEEEESRNRRGLRLHGCCFLGPARAAGREHSTTMDSSCGRRNKQRHQDRTEHHPRSQSNNNCSPSPSEASQIQQATGGSTGSRTRGAGAEQPRGAPAETTRAPTRPCGSAKSSKTGGGGVGAFGPLVGLPVVVTVCMAGLLGGRLWAVACVCAWLAAVSRLRRREAAAGEVGVNVDSTDHKRPVVLRELLERDRRKTVAA